MEVRDVGRTSYAASLGIRRGDLIVAVNSQPMMSIAHLEDMLRTLRGRNVSLYILRGGHKLIINAPARPLGAELKLFEVTESQSWLSPARLAEIGVMLLLATLLWLSLEY